ncbi:MAG: hypothetical protein J1E62_04530 [Lachnospiraceae bacterium]|nr:hypothetical protein [Lachnospiraceae bacterium]
MYIGNNYSIIGTGYLKMTHKHDILRVDGTFSTDAVQSHDGLLTNGRMELWGHFNQEGHQFSFRTAENFVIAFMGDKHYVSFAEESMQDLPMLTRATVIIYEVIYLEEKTAY